MAKKEIPYKIYLEESEMPRDWYNVRADMTKKPAPLLDPKTGKPITPEELGKVFCEELVKQELDDTNRYIPIPKEILDFYKMYRPAPLIRAYCLEKKLIQQVLTSYLCLHILVNVSLLLSPITPPSLSYSPLAGP